MFYFKAVHNLFSFNYDMFIHYLITKFSQYVAKYFADFSCVCSLMHYWIKVCQSRREVDVPLILYHLTLILVFLTVKIYTANAPLYISSNNYQIFVTEYKSLASLRSCSMSSSVSATIIVVSTILTIIPLIYY